MGKKSRAKNKPASTNTEADAVGPRQPCPCGSGRRYKACHGAAGGPPATLVKRPFADLPDEVDVVAMPARELDERPTQPVLPLAVHRDGARRLSRQLAERYATPLPQLTDEVAALAARVEEHLKRMGATWK